MGLNRAARAAHADASSSCAVVRPERPGRPLLARPVRTGHPKGVQLSHRDMIRTSRLGALNVLPAPTAVSALPIAHIIELWAGLGFAIAGVPVTPCGG